MIRNRFRPTISSNGSRISPSRHLGGGYFMAAAAASNFMLGQGDLQVSSLRRLSSNTSASSAVDARFYSNGLKLKGCSSSAFRNSISNKKDFKNDRCGVQKPRVYAPWVPQLLRVSEEIVKVDDSLNSASVVNGGGGASNRGSIAGVLDQTSPDKIMVAVDVDEVLGNFVSALNQFIADRYSRNHSVSEYHVYEFFKIWNCSRDEADIRVHEFFKSHYFKKGIYPIPGAREALQKLSEICNLSIVTSRQNVIKDHTIEWIEKHYPRLFQEMHFGNHFALDGQSRPKSEICKSLGAKVLIDDNPRYAIECAEVGIKVLLFDYENSYPWSKSVHIPQHPLVTKVHNWEEVENQLASWVVS